MQYIFGNDWFLRGSAVAVLGAISLYGLGITWSLLISITIWVVYVISIRIADGNIEERYSIENLESSESANLKKKRIIAKKKEKYEKKRKKATDNEDENDLDEGLKRSQELVDENMYGEIDYQAAASYHGVFAMPGSDSGKQARRYIPSLKSPQPLLSAFHSRISKREYNAMSPTIVPNRSYPLSPRSVFDNLQNRNSNSPMNMSWTVRESSMFRTQGLVAQKAISPPSGKYFSRIQPNFSEDSKRDIERQDYTIARKDRTLENQMDIGESDDRCSKEAIVKILQEKTASKRKRIIGEVPDATVSFQDRYNKKRRIDEDTLDETVTEFKKQGAVASDKRDVEKAETLKEYIIPSDDSNHRVEDGSKEKKQGGEKVRNRYGIKDTEVESITDDEDMEIDKTQSKRKTELDSEPRKGKKSREDIADGSKEKDTKQIAGEKNKTKSVTPVRSIETQTPTKFEDKNDGVKSSPRPSSTLKTPYKKVFVSGFPSNLKPGTREKRRKIPIYSGGFRFNENIEIGLDEYGSLGVTSASYNADKKAALERVMSLLDGTNDAIDGNSKENETTTASIATSKSEPQPLPLNQTTDTRSVATNNTVLSFTTSSQTSASLLPTLFPVATSSNSQATVNTTKSSSQKNDGPLISAPSNPLVGATSIASDNQPKTSISNFKDKEPSFSFGSQTSQSTTTTNIVTSSVATSTLAMFGMTQQGNLASDGFKFGSQSSSSAPTFSLSAPSISLSQISTANPSTLANILPPAEPVTSSQPSQPAFSGFGGFKFSSLAASNQSIQPTADIAKTVSSVEAAKPSIGFQFGTSSAQKQPTIGSTTETSLTMSNSSTFNTGTKSGGFSFGTTPASSTQASSSTTFAAVSFGVNAKAANTTNGVSSGNATALQSGFKFDTIKSAGGSLSTFSFGSNVSSQSPKVGMAMAGSLSVGKQSGDASTSIFQSPSTNVQLAFGTKVTASSVTPNLFGKPNTSVPFGSQPQFGAGQDNASSQLFTTPSKTQTPSLFGNSTQGKSSMVPTFGMPSQSSNTTGTLFPSAPSLDGNGNGTLFSAVSQTSSSSMPVFGASTQNVSTGSIFSASTQGSQSNGLLFGAQQASTAAPMFGTQSLATTFSFGANQSSSLFGSVSTTSTSAVPGGFSFSSNSQAASTNNKAIAQSGQASTSAFSQFGGQNNSGSNPFASSSIFGQAPVAATTTSGFSFGSTPVPAFGQASSNQSSFGASPATFQPVVEQTQNGGFNFAAAAAQKPTSFSFGGANSGGFTSRPGTPTPFSNPAAPSADVFASPQPQNVGFAMGSGAAPNRPTVRGRRRTRR